MVSRCAIVHRLREKHLNADGLSKKTEFNEGREKSDQNKLVVAAGFGVLKRDAYDSLETDPWLDSDCKELPEQEQLDCVEKVVDQVQILLRPGEVMEPRTFPVVPRKIEKVEQSPETKKPLTGSECTALANITRKSTKN